MAAHPIPDRIRETLVFELTLERDRQRLEFDSTEDRAFVVGASAHADVRVRRAGVPPVAFYLERRGDHAWLVPAYRRSSLRLNGAIVIAPRRLERHSLIEFAGVRAELDAVSESGASVRALFDDDAPTEIRENTRHSGLAYIQSLPDVDDRTCAEPEASAAPRPLSDVVRCPPCPVVRPAAGASVRRAESPRPAARNPPQLWVLLAQRPFESLALLLLVALVMAASAVAAAAILRLAGPL